MNLPAQAVRSEMERDERIQRQMDFIVEQQAQFSIDMEKLQASIEKHDESIAKIENVVLRLANGVVERFEKNENKTDVLEQKMTELAEAQKNTEERLNTVIYMFEKFISRETNGNSGS